MLESTVAFTLFDKVLTVLGLLREGKKQRTEKTDQALLALYAAITETKAYIQERRGGAPRDHRREYQIARGYGIRPPYRFALLTRNLQRDASKKEATGWNQKRGIRSASTRRAYL